MMLNPFTIYRNYKIFKRLVGMLEIKVDKLEKDRELQNYRHNRERMDWQVKENRFNDFLKKFPFHLSSFSSREDIPRDVEIFRASAVEYGSLSEKIDPELTAEFIIHKHYARPNVGQEIDYYKRQTYKNLIQSLIFKEQV